MTLALQLLALAGIGYLALAQHRHHRDTSNTLNDAGRDALEARDLLTDIAADVHGAPQRDDALHAELKAQTALALEPAGAAAAQARRRAFKRAHADGISDAAARVRRFADVRTQAHGRADDKAITLRGLASHLETYAQQDRS